MRTLSATLSAAQKQPSSKPYVKAVFSDYWGDRTRLRFSRFYTGVEVEYYHACCGANSIARGPSLTRARIDGTSKVLFTRRVAAPDAASAYNGAETSHGTVGTAQGVALASDGVSTIMLFYFDVDQLTLKVKTSTDDGQTYGAAATVATAAATAGAFMAAAVRPSDGEAVAFWHEGATVYRSRFSAGVWGARTAWTLSVNAIRGLACWYGIDWNLAVCGFEVTTVDPRVWTTIYGDGGLQAANTWSALKEVTAAEHGSLIVYRTPALVSLGAWRLFFMERYTGSLAYDREYATDMSLVNDFTFDLWREPEAWAGNFAGSLYGVAACVLDGAVWVTAAAGVWRAASPANADLDVTAEVLEVSVELAEYDGRARLVIRNDAPQADLEAVLGRYSAVPAPMGRGNRLELQAGYATTAGNELPSNNPTRYWVESLEIVTGGPSPRPSPRVRGGSSVIVVEARDAWWLLELWKARRQHQWAAGTKTVSQLLDYVTARAGLELGTITSSAAYTSLQPAFTIHPGESGKAAARRLLAMIPDEAMTRSAQISVRHPQAADASDYSYTALPANMGTVHAIAAARYRRLGKAINRARAFGPALFDEDFDFVEIEGWGERIGQVSDLSLTTTTLAGNRADYMLRDAEVRNRGDVLELFGVNVGQELYDVVALTDAQAGLTAAKRRVLALSWRYATVSGGDSRGRGPKGRYDMRLVVGSA